MIVGDGDGEMMLIDRLQASGFIEPSTQTGTEIKGHRELNQNMWNRSEQ